MLGRVSAWALGLSPILLLLLTWSDPLGSFGRPVRSYALPILIVEMVVISLAIGRWQGLSFRYLPAWLCLVGVIAIAWATAINAPHAPTSIFRTTFWMFHLAFGISMARLAADEPTLPEDLTKALLSGFSGFAVLYVIFAVSVNRPDYNFLSASPAYSNIRWLGYFAAAAIGLSAHGLKAGSKLTMLTCTLAFAIAFWTGSRGAIAGVLIGFVVASILVSALRSRVLWGGLAATALIGLLLSIALDSVIPIQGVDRMMAQGEGIMGGSGRVELWVATMQSILQKPWFGWGEAQIGYLPGRAYRVVQPHNVILQVVHAWGLVGAALLTVPAALLARKILASRDEQILSLKCGVIVLAAFSMIDGTLYHVHSLAIFAACAGVIAGRKRAGADLSMPRVQR